VNYCTLAGDAVLGPSGSQYGTGGGAASCNLKNCWLTGNFANEGGAAYHCYLQNCALTKNSSVMDGGAAYLGTLINCTVTGNSSGGYSSSFGGAVASATLTNCIVFGNSEILNAPSNYLSSTFSFCCTAPLPAGPGNFVANPQFDIDAVHLTPSSPCRGVGTNGVVVGVDLDGQPWANPPAVGCVEYLAAPLIFRQPATQVSGSPVQMNLGLLIGGQPPFTCFWTLNGTVLQNGAHYSSANGTNLTINNFGPDDAGAYQVVVSNAFGVVTSGVVQVVVHCADAAAATPLAPYQSWQTAASSIQDAIDAALPGEFVLVTNGVYSTGGRAMAGTLTNRVVLTQPLTVSSVNGPSSTFILGAWDPVATNGPGAVRCAWVNDGALLSGFTLQGGATQSSGDSHTLQSGGGVFATSTNGVVADCVLATNAANYSGGAAYRGQLSRCLILGNSSQYVGGGSSESLVLNSFFTENSATWYGGGACGGNLFNCTLIGNSTTESILGGGGFCSSMTGGGPSTVGNCILYENWAGGEAGPLQGIDWQGTATFSSCCTEAAPPWGVAILTADPQLLDGRHIAVTSPCRGAGNSLFASGTDIDGEPWANPPSIGCDEVWEANLTGPLAVSLVPRWPAIAQGARLPFFGSVTGRVTRVGWSFGDGSILTNASEMGQEHAWTDLGNYTVTFTAFNTTYPAGVSTNVNIQVIPLVQPTLSFGARQGGTFSLSFSGQPGVFYILEGTTI